MKEWRYIVKCQTQECSLFQSQGGGKDEQDKVAKGLKGKGSEKKLIIVFFILKQIEKSEIQ